MRLLLVEDDLMLGRALETSLRQSDYVVDWMKDGESAILALETASYGIVVLDINLPKANGFAVLKQLRLLKRTDPVIIMTARDALSDRIDGLDLGADDYLVKPFNLDELLARIRAVVRRGSGHTASKVFIRDMEIDLAARTIVKSDLPVKLATKEFRVLKYLLEQTGKIVSKGEIEENIYESNDGVESNTIETAIYSIRKKLGHDVVTTIRGVGYMIAS